MVIKGVVSLQGPGQQIYLFITDSLHKLQTDDKFFSPPVTFLKCMKKLMIFLKLWKFSTLCTTLESS